jgi:hypothetical protein
MTHVPFSLQAGESVLVGKKIGDRPHLVVGSLLCRLTKFRHLGAVWSPAMNCHATCGCATARGEGNPHHSWWLL